MAQSESTVAPPPSTNASRWAPLGVALLVGGLLRLYVALADDGIYWPDEVFQSLEPAHRLLFGYGYVAWEFIDGARTWALPALVAAVMGPAAWVSDSPATYLGAVRVAFALFSLSCCVGVYGLARALNANPIPASVAACACALAAPLVYFGPRAMSENVSALLVVFAFWAASKPGTRFAVVAASLAGVSVFFRLQNGVFCAGLLGVYLARRAYRDAGVAAATLFGWAMVLGLFDLLTWGRLFHSTRVYLGFNLVEGKASGWGTSPWTYYARVLFTSMPTVTPLLIVGVALAMARRAAWPIAATALAYLVLHSMVPHKELRFLLPSLPLVFALAGVGLSELGERKGRLAGMTGALLLVTGSVLSASELSRLTFKRLGQYEDDRAHAAARALDDFGPVNRLLLAAHEQPDLCGLKNEVAHPAWTGGYSHLHRRVPLYPPWGPPRSSGHFNYVITRRGPPGHALAEDGPVALVRIADAPCRADPAFSWRLP